MARTVAELPSGSRITDYVSLGVIAKAFPSSKVLTILVLLGHRIWANSSPQMRGVS